MRIVFAGTPTVAVPTLRALAEHHDVIAVLTRQDAPVGRKRVLTPSPVAAAAAALQIPTIKANRIDAEVSEQIAASGADLGVIVAYGGLLREPLLSAPQHGWINLHFSELPDWRGAAPVQRALIAGETNLGVSVFRLVPELDAGPVLASARYPFAFGTSAGDALAGLAERSIPQVLDAVQRSASDPGTPQTGEPTYAPKLSREDGRLDPRATTLSLIQHWAGVTPEPGAFIGDVKLVELGALDLPVPAPLTGASPGSCHLIGSTAWLVSGDGGVPLARVQPAGKPAMDAAAWLRGRGGEVQL